MIAFDPRAVAQAAVAASPGRPATAVLHDSDGIRLVVFRLAPGQSVPPHRNRSPVQLAVLAGTGILSGESDDGPVERPCAAGDVVVYRPSELHGMRAGHETLVLLATIVIADR